MQTLISLLEECILLTEQLIHTVRDEKKFLIELKSDELLQNNLEKENIINLIFEKRQFIEKMQKNASEKDLNHPEYLALRDVWKDKWTTLQNICMDNRYFISHSLNNLNMFMDHLKKLILNRPTYSAKGVQVGVPQSGKVVEGAY
jgi:hypothetical protein